jgi:hypothetical protein
MNMIELTGIVDRQIEHNKGKNLFYFDAGKTLYFTDETINQIESFNEISMEDGILLIDYATRKTLQEFCRVNQYLSFNKQSVRDLRCMYRLLLTSIKNKRRLPGRISVDHYDRLKQWLQSSNPFAAKIYPRSQIDIQPVHCAEYEAELQTGVLQLELDQLTEPVLDIGCGTQAKLVKAFQVAGYNAYGIDRFANDLENITTADWLDFKYGVKKWGTIISHLGFSNHFNHHNLRKDGLFVLYARKYMEILESLKPGGRFHYSPSLPFIENYVDVNKFRMIQYPVDGVGLKTTVLTRLL